MKIITKINKIEDILRVHLCQCSCSKLRDHLKDLKIKYLLEIMATHNHQYIDEHCYCMEIAQDLSDLGYRHTKPEAINEDPK